MNYLYNFGLSQDDANTEQRALELKKGDRLICIASGGEVPLNLLTYSDIHIDAVDLSLAQLQLSRLKITAAIHLECIDAAQFLGYMRCSREDRMRLFKQLLTHFDSSQKSYWLQRPEIFKKGPIHNGRFEQYISRINWIVLSILNKKKMEKLCGMNDIVQQGEYFDKKLRTSILKFIFRIIFHPKIYKKRGMDPRGLLHSGKTNIATFFFNRFRDFCTSTPARNNYFLQLTFFNRILHEDALPDYLKEEGNRLLRKRKDQLNFYHVDLLKQIKKSPFANYNKFALSNVGDWISNDEYTDLLSIISQRSSSNSRILLRYIHHIPKLEESMIDFFVTNQEFGRKLESLDRYPFYGLMPITINSNSR